MLFFCVRASVCAGEKKGKVWVYLFVRCVCVWKETGKKLLTHVHHHKDRCCLERRMDLFTGAHIFVVKPCHQFVTRPVTPCQISINVFSLMIIIFLVYVQSVQYQRSPTTSLFIISPRRDSYLAYYLAIYCKFTIRKRDFHAPTAITNSTTITRHQLTFTQFSVEHHHVCLQLSGLQVLVYTMRKLYCPGSSRITFFPRSVNHFH